MVKRRTEQQCIYYSTSLCSVFLAPSLQKSHNIKGRDSDFCSSSVFSPYIVALFFPLFMKKQNIIILKIQYEHSATFNNLIITITHISANIIRLLIANNSHANH